MFEAEDLFSHNKKHRETKLDKIKGLSNMSKVKKNGETPVIRIGKMGISEGAIKEIKRQLKEHKVVKVKFLNTIVTNKEEYNSQVDQLLEQLEDTKVKKKIGHTVILHKP